MTRRSTFPALAALALLGTVACDRTPTGAASRRLEARGQSPNAAFLAKQGAGPLLALSSDGVSAVIDNGTVQLGVRPEGNLNTDPATDEFGQISPPYSYESSTYAVGLRYMPTNGEATAPGCLCEGWGASANGDVSGYANVSGGTNNIEVESFTQTATTAVSTTIIRDGSGNPVLRVIHDYHPSPATPNLFEARVTIENVSGAPLTDVRYTRAMDWDIPPTTFDEIVTIQGWGATNLLHSDNNGFESGDPLRGYYDYGWTNQNIYRRGDWNHGNDHGAVFDFGFGALAASGDASRKSFFIYYGGANNEADAMTALARQHVEVYSLGQPNCGPNLPPYGDGPPGTGGGDDGSFGGSASLVGDASDCVEQGGPNTFIFAFASVGGTAVNNPPPTPVLGPPGFVYRGNEGVPLCLDITATDPDGDELTFLIEWGDGSSTTTTSKKPCHVYADGPRTYTSQLAIVANDGHGGVSPAATTSAIISNLAPEIKTVKLAFPTLNAPRAGQSWLVSWVWQDRGVVDAEWSWSINWGDGTSTAGTKSNITEVSSSHVYATPGTRTVTFRITDKDGGTVAKSIPVNVKP